LGNYLTPQGLAQLHADWNRVAIRGVETVAA
jgi:hypothetical protein